MVNDDYGEPRYRARSSSRAIRGGASVNLRGASLDREDELNTIRTAARERKRGKNRGEGEREENKSRRGIVNYIRVPSRGGARRIDSRSRA